MRTVNVAMSPRLLMVGVLIAGATTVVAADPASAASPHNAASQSTASSGGLFVSTTPTRVLDTASGLGAPKAKVKGNHQIAVQIAGRGGVPTSGVSAVALSLTSSGATATGTLTAFADGTKRPWYSNLNFSTKKAVTKAAVTKLGSNGKIDFRVIANGATNIAADVYGYYTAGTATAAGSFVPLTPSRILDTRTGTGAAKGRVASGHRVVLKVRGAGGVAAKAGTALLKVMALKARGTTTVTVYPDHTTRPADSLLTVSSGQIASNLIALPLSSAGKVDLYVSGGSTQLVAEAVGYYLAGTPAAAGAYEPLAPAQVLQGKTVKAGNTVSVPVAGAAGVPTTGVGAVMLKLTAAKGQGTTTVTAYADGAARPGTVSLSVPDASPTSSLVVTRLGSDGKVTFAVGGKGSVQLGVQVVGYVLASSASSASWQAQPLSIPDFGTLSDISCVTVTFCVAVGQSGTTSFAETMIGTSWTYTALHAGGAMVVVPSVSCRAVGSCVAVGSIAGASEDDPARLFAFTLANGAWTSKAIPLPGGEFPPSAATFRALSCASTTACTAIGVYTDPVGEFQESFSATLLNGHWSIQDAGRSFPTGIACTAPGQCVASATGLDDTGFVFEAVVLTLADGVWTGQTLPTPPLAPPDDQFIFGGSAEANGVSCSSASACSIVGDYDGTDDNQHPLIDSLVNGEWRVVPVANPRGLAVTSVDEVSCPVATSCTAVSRNAAASTPPITATLTNGVWTTGTIPPAYGDTITAISCVSATACFAVGASTVYRLGSTTAPIS